MYVLRKPSAKSSSNGASYLQKKGRRGEKRRAEQSSKAKAKESTYLMIDKRLQVDCRMSNSFVSVCI